MVEKYGGEDEFIGKEQTMIANRKNDNDNAIGDDIEKERL